MKIFSGTSCLNLAVKISSELSLKLSDCELSRFPNGENKVLIKEDCQNETVIILQNFCDPVDSNIMQFCLMIDAVRRMKPEKIIGVIPWLGYAKQNKVFRPGESLAAEVVARIVSSSGVDEVILLDVHSESVKSFFTVPVRELAAADLFIDWINSKRKTQISKPQLKTQNENNSFVVVSPDGGAISRNQYVAEKMNLPLFVIDKERDLATGKITIKGLRDSSGNLLRTTDYVLRTNNVIMFDDMILSGGTVIKDVEFLKSLGAADVYFFATHFCATENTHANLRQTPVKKIVVTNSLEFDMGADLGDKLEKLDISKMFTEEIEKYD
jgi:ribose-phosphate pyrophosphokinase